MPPGPGSQVQAVLRLFDRTGLVYERVRTAMGNGMVSAASARDNSTSRAPVLDGAKVPVIGPPRNRSIS